jgi:predicted Rossmann fold flavoprotein
VEGKNKIVVIGGGAAGFFTAISAAEKNPKADITILEGGTRVLRKVKISGGGRCNVTHNCFDPLELSKHYPRGSRELRGAFHYWQPRDTINWFEKRGVKIKTESDGRMFPVSNQSQTIIDCLQQCCRKLGISVQLSQRVSEIVKVHDQWKLTLSSGNTISAEKVCLALGSLKESKILEQLRGLGHRIHPLLPSLFAFNLPNHPMKDLSGLSVQNATIQTMPKGKQQNGPLLITHRGLSGPAILKASAWDAVQLSEVNYKFEVSINWTGSRSPQHLSDYFNSLRKNHPTRRIMQNPFPELPKRLWNNLVSSAHIENDTTWAHLSREKSLHLQNNLSAMRLKVDGKTTNKDEFVTCGGICLKEVDFRSMGSKLHQGLFFAGECLNLDGITGGFNFQAAWTTGRIAGESMGKISEKSSSA